MATLHVRNVPEPIYELLRECAEQEGRSIGGQAIYFIQQGVLPRGVRRLPWSRRGLHRFTPASRDATRMLSVASTLARLDVIGSLTERGTDGMAA